MLKQVLALLESLVLPITVAILITMPAEIVSAASSTPEQTQAATISGALHAVVQAAKQYQAQTGNEATSVDQLVQAGLLKNPDKYVRLIVNDSMWQVWGNGTGAYVMWDDVVSAEVCELLFPGGALPTDLRGKPQPDKGFQCIKNGDSPYYLLLEPVYIHK